jgi:hypothetical protein
MNRLRMGGHRIAGTGIWQVGKRFLNGGFRCRNRSQPSRAGWLLRGSCERRQRGKQAAERKDPPGLLSGGLQRLSCVPFRIFGEIKRYSTAPRMVSLINFEHSWAVPKILPVSNQENSMAEPCSIEKGSNPPVCGVHSPIQGQEGHSQVRKWRLSRMGK